MAIRTKIAATIFVEVATIQINAAHDIGAPETKRVANAAKPGYIKEGFTARIWGQGARGAPADSIARAGEVSAIANKTLDEGTKVQFCVFRFEECEFHSPERTVRAAYIKFCLLLCGGIVTTQKRKRGTQRVFKDRPQAGLVEPKTGWLRSGSGMQGDLQFRGSGKREIESMLSLKLGRLIWLS